MKKGTWLRNVLMALPVVCLTLAAQAYAATGVPLVFTLAPGINPSQVFLQFISTSGSLSLRAENT